MKCNVWIDYELANDQGEGIDRDPGAPEPIEPQKIGPFRTTADASRFGALVEKLASLNEADIGRMVKCATREVAMRKRVYPKWVFSRKMDEHVARDEQAVMKEITKLLIEIMEGLGHKALEKVGSPRRELTL